MSTAPADCSRGWCPDGACHGARLDSLLTPEARWLWEQLAARADKRGERSMTGGTTVITAPEGAGQRAAVLGLIGTRILAPGERCRIRLEELTLRLRRHGARLTPGAVAAHAVGRPLGSAVAERARQTARAGGLRLLRARLGAALPGQAPVRPSDEGWEELHHTGRVARILQHPAPEELLRRGAEVLRLLPVRGCVDRRVLAHRVTGDPHGLDAGSDLAGLVLAEAALAGVTAPGMPLRAAWSRLRVALDALSGGLLSVGVHPKGWTLPARHPCILPPYTLAEATWPGPDREEDSWVFVTENPSITAAALALPANVPVRLLCTAGTVSAVEVDALARLADSGWRIAVRADFDAAGLALVRTVLAAVPQAEAWHMTADYYTASLHPSPFEPVALAPDRLGDTPWDPSLAASMRACGQAAYEEGLIDELLTDLHEGRPSAGAPAHGHPRANRRL
ncbi:DUF2399 domain-containing protein [Streptomyces alanosinicus]|uniref:DUF2399 domain-containing protein n=1 Tax=Streptomyces alanosinicus TaxID=68171 RepID=A0A918YQJ0_9ACTN|nr:DUF2399 domain-containing protein [Streptomyces alanosinicus]GHE11928.1 hypothetical protein GCM10010339_73390 [Streptomyces alanosinicus]